MKSLITHLLIGLIGILLILLSGNESHAQRKKIDLDDIDIQGELQKDDRLRILGRQRNQLNNYVKFRTNFRKEIIEELPRPEPKFTY
jgi:hypothetical protein